MIKMNITALLGERNHTMYWLARATGLSYQTIHRLQTPAAKGINFETLDKICRALQCDPGDVLVQVKSKRREGKSAKKKTR